MSEQHSLLTVKKTIQKKLGFSLHNNKNKKNEKTAPQKERIWELADYLGLRTFANLVPRIVKILPFDTNMNRIFSWGHSLFFLTIKKVSLFYEESMSRSIIFWRCTLLIDTFLSKLGSSLISYPMLLIWYQSAYYNMPILWIAILWPFTPLSVLASLHPQSHDNSAAFNGPFCNTPVSSTIVLVLSLCRLHMWFTVSWG